MASASSRIDKDEDLQRARKASLVDFDEETDMAEARARSLLQKDEDEDCMKAAQMSKRESEAANNYRNIEESTLEWRRRTDTSFQDRTLGQPRRNAPCRSVRIEMDYADPTGRLFANARRSNLYPHPVLITQVRAIRYRLRQETDWQQVAVPNIPVGELLESVIGSREARVFYVKTSVYGEEMEVEIPHARMESASRRPVLVGELAEDVGGYENIRFIVERCSRSILAPAFAEEKCNEQVRCNSNAAW